MLTRWITLALLAVTILAASGCASSRGGRYGPYGRYGSVYGPRQRVIVVPRRDYRWERQQRAREAWLRKQARKQERYERRRDRDWHRHGRR